VRSDADQPVKDLDRLVREGLRLAETVARRLQRSLGGAFDRDELLAIARPALLEAARAYDPERAPFAPYIVQRVKWAILDEARKARRRKLAAQRVAAVAALERLADDADRETTGDEPLRTEAEYQANLTQFLAQRAAAMAVGLVSLADTDRHSADQSTPEERLAREQLRRELEREIEKLPERQRALVERHYFAGEKFETIAADLGISKSWASRLHAQAMDALAASLRSRRADF
jgi:RNA polymerase sigma factor for flagellar operon FliA